MGGYIQEYSKPNAWGAGSSPCLRHSLIWACSSLGHPSQTNDAVVWCMRRSHQLQILTLCMLDLTYLYCHFSALVEEITGHIYTFLNSVSTELKLMIFALGKQIN